MQVAPALTYLIDAHDERLNALVVRAAGAVDRPAGPLRLQALLQLPRLADQSGYVSSDAVEREVRELARELPVLHAWHAPTYSSPRALRFRPVDDAHAREVMLRFHYLRSEHDGRAYGLYGEGDELIAIAVSSEIDVASLETLLATAGRATGRARVISRVFAFEGAPVNSISYLLSRVGRSEAELGVTDLVTYVNPNLGFHGSSYRASGWVLLGDEPGTTYRYLDGRYITDRHLASAFGRMDDDGYRRLLGDRFDVSRMALRPLLVFHRTLDR